MADDAPEQITFIASLPPIQSAISMDGMGDGARIKLDIPRSDASAVLLLQHYFAGEVFEVTVKRIVDKSRNTNKHQRKGTF